MQYLYSDGDFLAFHGARRFEQYTAGAAAVADNAKWLKDGTHLHRDVVEHVPLGDPPQHIDLKVVETDPACGAIPPTGGQKPAKMETGAWCACRCSHEARCSGSTREPANTSRARSRRGHRAVLQARSQGKAITSSMLRAPSASIATRSNPSATPAQSGRPLASAARKSASGVSVSSPRRCRSAISC